MKILDKLALQKNLGGIVLFKEGLFLRAFNESSYILTQLLKQELKVKCYEVKCLNNQVITESVFPCTTLHKRLPTAVITAFGARLSGDYDLSDYAEWHRRRWHEENVVRSGSKAAELSLKTASSLAPSHSQKTVYKNSVMLPLTQQQLSYLKTWQKGLYPLEVDFGFIESLKHQIMSLAK